MIKLPRTTLPRVRAPNDHEAPCAVCDKPIDVDKHKLFVWVHDGGASVVTDDEGKELNASGRKGADMGLQPVGRECVRKNPEIKPYVVEIKD